MRVEGCDLADTKGARKCPHCGERHFQKIHSVNSVGRPVKVECPACRKTWTWPTVREDELARKEAMRRHSRESYLRNRDRILAYEREHREEKTRKARERRHRKRAYIHKPRACASCGIMFVPQNRNHKYCCRECANRRTPDKKRKDAKYKDLVRRRDAAYITALEQVAREVGRLDECRAIRKEIEVDE